MNMAKNSAQFTWTDDEAELLLKITNEYKVSAALRARFAILNLRAQVKFSIGNHMRPSVFGKF